MTSLSDVRPVGYPQAFLACLLWAGCNLAIILVLFGPPPSSGAAARVLGELAVTAVAAAVMVWLVPRHRPSGRPRWQLAALALVAFTVLRLLASTV